MFGAITLRQATLTKKQALGVVVFLFYEVVRCSSAEILVGATQEIMRNKTRSE